MNQFLKKSIKVAVFSFFIHFLLINSLHSEVFYSDNFDHGIIDKSWKIATIFDDELMVEPDPSGRPGKSLKIKWISERFQPSIRRTKGSDIVTRKFSPDAEIWTAFEIYFSFETFAKDSLPVILQQVHDTRDSTRNGKFCEDWKNPISAIIYVNGELEISYLGDKKPCTGNKRNRSYTDGGSFKLGTPKMNAWNSFIVHYKLSPYSNNGILEVWLNGKKQVSKKKLNIGFNDLIGPHISYGFYYYQGKSDYSFREAYFDNIFVGSKPLNS